MADTWYWEAEDCGGQCYFNICEITDNYPYGEIVEILYAKPRSLFVCELIPAIDSDTGDSFLIECSSREECEFLMNEELDRRAWCLSWGGI